MESLVAHSGIGALDEVLQGLRPGDNVVWQVDSLGDYQFFAEPFAEGAIAEGRDCVYLRFAAHPPALLPQAGLTIIEVDPSPGFDFFSQKVHRIIEERGTGVYYLFDNLSALVVEWATDEMLANFFQVTCPFLFDLDTVTYFALTRGQHANSAVARIRDTTQILIDVFHAKGGMYIHPVKVWDRYTPQMFLPHLISEGSWSPVFQSGDAAAVSASARRYPVKGTAGSIAPWDSVYRQLVQYRDAGMDLQGDHPEVISLKQELCRMMIGSHPQFNQMADRYLRLEDLFRIRERLVGSGRIGGKAAGMLLARRILLEDQAGRKETGEIDFSQVLEDHDSFYVGSDVFFTFLVHNDLFRLRLQLARNSQLSREEFAEVERRFLAGRFPPPIMEQFHNLLDYFGQAPIIVRSSSLLEDSFGNAFAGKYRSEFCTNQGSPEERLKAFLSAVKLVYASALNPDALSYRRRRGLGESDEQMAILVQRVSGMPYSHYFFPSMAGVAFSRNLYAWNNRIDPRQGVIRLVFGLGTRAVERVGGDYPRMIAVSHPRLRPEIGPQVAKYSQHQVDLLDLQANRMATLSLAEVLAPDSYPHLYLLVSVMKEGYPYDPVFTLIDGPPDDLVLTFNNLLARTDFVKVMGAMLGRLESVYAHPVDIEFTASLDPAGRTKINLLQCRPLFLPGSSGPVAVPADLPRERVLFRSQKMMSGGRVGHIRYILYIDPRRYNAMESLEAKRALGRVVGQINAHPRIAEGKIVMMGPGRWGSNNIDLGVNVGYADIDNAAVLVEIAREEAGHVPEVSYGTHFFQDLVEDQIIYLPLYPDDPAAEFNSAFFERAPNLLADLLPEASGFSDWVRVIDVLSFTDGLTTQVVADPQSQNAICYLE
jgi:hypothetical protein